MTCLVYSSDPRYLLVGEPEVKVMGPCNLPIALIFY